ncbi:MAG TPA: lysophospholipid acyltransferase family protein [Labilithrix sp.]|nr:lysophospholipid acyltransferase family protein [Labilithrix sp.]
MHDGTSSASENATPSSPPPPLSGVGESPPPSARARTIDDVVTRDLLDFGDDMLTPVERWQIGFVRRTFESPGFDRVIRALQRHLGANWIEQSIKNLRQVHGLDRLPVLARDESTILVSNHRSFFDLYVVTAYLVKRGMPQRLVFPVRSQFFYDRPLGLAVNGLMSFFAMYPPVFRERKRAALNLASLDEVVRLLRNGGAFVGLHPEGMRNKGDDPYELLPAQGGVGRIIQAARGKARVIPVFVNGLGNDIVKQVRSNFLKNGDPVTVVFGEPIDFGTMLDGPPSPRLHRKISEHALEKIRALGEEDRAIRARHPG